MLMSGSVVYLVSPISCDGGVGQAAAQLQHHLVGQTLRNYEVKEVRSKVGDSSVQLRLLRISKPDIQRGKKHRNVR